jgi:hypothetical protein
MILTSSNHCSGVVNPKFWVMSWSLVCSTSFLQTYSTCMNGKCYFPMNRVVLKSISDSGVSWNELQRSLVVPPTQSHGPLP